MAWRARSGGMAGKKRLLRADSDRWGVSGAIGFVLSILCISLSSRCPLRSRHSITQPHIGGGEASGSLLSGDVESGRAAGPSEANRLQGQRAFGTLFRVLKNYDFNLGEETFTVL
ncbi:hypothetical protein NQZ68_029039 [Dissostichus eleginoides]|nr:hypothetical protein NQZ68_029039 [Dissostichus eleginoides]